MALITPAGPDWAYCTHNFPATPAYDAPGVSVTPGQNDADGTAVDLFGSALGHDVEYLRLGFAWSGASASDNNDALATVLIDPAGGTSWASFIPYLIVGASSSSAGSSTTNTSGGPWSSGYDFPIWVPSGATLGVRIRVADAGATGTFYVTAFAFGGNANPASWWAGQRVTAIGINEASSAGTAHTAGSSGSFSAWANLGSTLAADCGALQFGVNGVAGGFYSSNNYQFEFGVSSNRIGPPIIKCLTSSEAGGASSTGPIFKRLPSGTQLQVRGACSGTAQSPNVAAYAVH